MNVNCSSLLLRMSLCASLLFSLLACGGGSGSPSTPEDQLAAIDANSSIVVDDAKKSPKPKPSPAPTEPTPIPAPAPSPTEPIPAPTPAPTPAPVPAPTDLKPLVPATFFGMHIAAQLHEGWPTVPFATQRIWDSWPLVSWDVIHTGPGRFNWAPLDALVADSERRGVDLIYTFGYVPRWASTNPTGDCNGATAGSCYAPTTAAWNEFVRAATARYQGRIKYWEIWNEPDAGNFWKGSHAQMAEMTRQAYPIIKNTGGIVLSPAPQGMNAHRWLDLHFAATGTAYADIVAFHAYLHGAPETLKTLVDNIRAVQAKYGISAKPLWDTEHSWGDVSWPMGADEDQQSAWLARFLAMSYTVGIDRTIWYGWEHFDWGTLFDRRAKRITKAGVAYDEVYKWMIGSHFAPCTATGSVYQCRITRENGYEAIMLWNSSATSAFTIPNGYTRLRTIEATARSVAAGEQITLGMKPILVEKLR